MKKTLSIFLLICFSVSAFGQIQKSNQSALTIDKIMQNPEKWIGTAPENLSWSEDSKTIFFSWNPEKDTLSSVHSYSLLTRNISKVLPEEKSKLSIHEGEYRLDYSAKVFVRNGNIFLLDLKNGTEKQLTDWLGQTSQVHFLADQQSISFVFNQNLYLLKLESGMIKQLTNFVSGEKKKEKKGNAQDEWLEAQQMQLFDVLKSKDELRKTQEYRANLDKEKQMEPVYLGTGRLRSISLSPSGKYVIYSVIENASAEKETELLNFVSESGYSETEPSRRKVGGPQTAASLRILNLETDKSYKVETSNIPGIKDLPAYKNDYPHSKLEKSDDRKVNVLGPFWNPTKDQAIVVARSHNSKDRWIMQLDLASGEPKLLDRQHDEAWVGGPGIESYPMSPGLVGWMPDNQSIWFQSEESGYSHLYTLNTISGEKKQLTQGQFEVYDPFISKDKKWFYFTANKVHPGVRHFYRIPVWGGEPVQITSMEGNNEVQLSPDEKQLAIRFSSANQPWELYLQANKPGAAPQKITQSLTKEFEAYPWRKPEFVSYQAEDGQTVYARLYRPVSPEKNGPAVVFVHGAGYLQNAHKWWSQYQREYQFHNFLVDNGYTVLDIDYRGSSGYGRDWRTGIYRNMGGKDLTDHVDGARFLVEKYGISPARIGIYGGSYGGFITLMAMFKTPDVFKAGAALRSVTDWAHYNHGYTSNILNTPVEDSLAFVRSSPIYYAAGLKGALLMCHGMIDDNVHFQDIVRLSQRLIELGKENWELAVYPVERHSFTEPTSWADEYKRIYKLFEENLK
ncbi:MAG: prolyl oligopeptidase family serine peptidase [Prolixibacteraceae bacterium]|nr:prolyl oligopeptidase family serine peptidase [Prolixibacteraceae bacterium]